MSENRERMSIMNQQESRNERLRGRSKRCVCKYCGGELKIKSIIFNEFIEARSELYCPECDRIEFGVEPEIYQCAKYYVMTEGQLLFLQICLPVIANLYLQRIWSHI